MRTVASVLARSNIPLGIMPLGTLNHFARDLGISFIADRAVTTIAAGEEHTVDVREVNDVIFDKKQKPSGGLRRVSIAVNRPLLAHQRVQDYCRRQHRKIHSYTKSETLPFLAIQCCARTSLLLPRSPLFSWGALSALLPSGRTNLWGWGNDWELCDSDIREGCQESRTTTTFRFSIWSDGPTRKIGSSSSIAVDIKVSLQGRHSPQGPATCPAYINFPVFPQATSTLLKRSSCLLSTIGPRERSSE